MNKLIRNVIVVLLACALVSGGLFAYFKFTQPDYSNVAHPIVTIEMESGEFMRVELYPAVAPYTVANFVSLIQDGFYDGLIFHRVIPGFMIQGGDPSGDGSGGPGFTIKGEFTDNGFENTLEHARGVISMARRADYNSAGSQFFLMHADYPSLNGQYAAFGRLIDDESFATLDAIAATKTDASDKPLTEWRIKTVTVETYGVEYNPVRTAQ